MCRNFASPVALYGLLIVLCGVALLPFHQVIIAHEPPAGVFSPRPGEFLSADYPHVFDRIPKDGLTIEIWFFLAGEADIPEDWVLFGKNGSYWAEIRSMGQSWEVQVEVHLQRKDGNKHSHADFDSQRLNQWLHIALQIQGVGSELFFNGNPRFASRSEPGGWKLVRSESPLMIGWRKRADNSLQEMWIDQVRISKTLRYPGEPPRPLPLDKGTLALWNFDEGPGARLYAEAAGKRYTLIRNSPLAVNRKGKLTTVWGKIKKNQ